MLKNKNIKLAAGFTLIETLVAIGLFSVVMSVAFGTLLVMVDANAKSQAIKTAVNNVNFALDLVSNAIETSVPDYGGVNGSVDCYPDQTYIDNHTQTDNCTIGGAGLVFFREMSDNSTPSKNVKVQYEILVHERTESVVGNMGVFLRRGGYSSPEISLLPDNVKVMNEKPFYVLTDSATGRERVMMTLKGEVVGKKDNTDFVLQTGVSKTGI
jgi:prepilin-type N-terminal cleavage/methylation domain-containing protein